MTAHLPGVRQQDSLGKSVLYHAVQGGCEEDVKVILSSASNVAKFLNVAEPSNGWTPLFIACIEGQLSVVKLLLEAGAEQNLTDIFGWTEKEHAVFRGHMKVAELLSQYEARNYRVPPCSEVLRTGTVRPESQFKHLPGTQTTPAPRMKSSGIGSDRHQIQSDQSQLFVSLGPSNTRTNLKPVNLDSFSEIGICVAISAFGAYPTSAYRVEKPSLGNMINKPLQFSTEHLDKVNLKFEIFSTGPSSGTSDHVIGTGVALLKTLWQSQGSKHESLNRDYTIPVLQNRSMNCIGTITFSLLVITPFRPLSMPRQVSLGFWKQDGSTQIVGHRGSGANSTTRTTLQIGENTIQSFLTASSLGASCVEFDVQLTKDYLPVIFHDFLVMEMGGDVPLQTLTFDQFMHLSRSQASRGDLPSAAESRYLDRTKDEAGLHGRPRSHSLNTYDDYRNQDLMERMRFAEEGVHNNIKGNLRGHSIQEPSTALEQLLTTLPKSIAFNLEIKYPMLWEAQDRSMDLYAFELNFYVDTILATLFQHCGNRNITLSSFSPEICILLKCKQQTFPILFINKAGSVPTGDVRAGSVQGAIEFAKAWDLAGIVILSDPFVMCPRLLGYAKAAGLVVASYGNLNDEPECALIQAEAGLDAIMTNKVRLISETLARGKSATL